MPKPSANIRLRALEPDDLDRLYLWENLPGMWRYGFAPAPLSRHQLWQYIKSYDSNPLSTRQLRLMIMADDEAAGTIDLYNIDIRNRRSFVGVMIAPQFRRQGIASEALRLIVEYSRENLGLHQILVTVAADNEASITLFSHGGFEPITQLPEWLMRSDGVYINAILMRRLLNTSRTDNYNSPTESKIDK